MQKMPPDLQHAARTAALRVEKLLLEMLVENKLGEVAVVVSWSQLEPEKRVTTKAKTIRIARGQMSVIEKVE